MNLKGGGWRHRIEWLMIYFIIFQPLLDITHTLSSRIPHLETVSVAVRMLFMIVGIGYILYCAKNKDQRKFMVYILLLGIAILAQLIINMILKSEFSIFSEIKFLSRIFYFPVMLFVYILVFSSLKKSSSININKYIAFAMSITGSIMVISALTSTYHPTYEYADVGLRIGSTGWFFAGNELGSFLAICFPIVLLYSMKKTTQLSNIYFWIPSLLMVISLISIGTKVAYAALILVLFIGAVMCLKEFISHRKKDMILNGTLAIVLIISSICVFPISPISKSTEVSLQKAGFNDGNIKDDQDDQIENGVEDLNDAGVTSLVFSGRNKFLEKQKVLFDHAAPIRKIFGLGKEKSIVERDFHDLFFTFGFIGCALLILPLIYYAYRLMRTLLSDIKRSFSLTYVLIASSLALSLGIAFIAGHVFTAPAVSIYVVFILAYAITKLEIEK